MGTSRVSTVNEVSKVIAFDILELIVAKLPKSYHCQM